MKIIIEGEPKGIAALALSVQERQPEQVNFTLKCSNANANDLIVKNNKSRKIVGCV